MSTPFVCRSAIAFPYCTNDYLCVSLWETRLEFPYGKMTILVSFQFEKKVADPEKVSGKSGNWEILKSADSEIPDFSLYNYNRKIWICNTHPPLDFSAKSSDFAFIFKKGVDTKIAAESIMQNGRVHNTEWGESVMQSGKVYKA